MIEGVMNRSHWNRSPTLNMALLPSERAASPPLAPAYRPRRLHGSPRAVNARWPGLLTIASSEWMCGRKPHAAPARQLRGCHNGLGLESRNGNWVIASPPYRLGVAAFGTSGAGAPEAQ